MKKDLNDLNNLTEELDELMKKKHKESFKKIQKEFKRKRINEQKIISMIEEEEENEILRSLNWSKQMTWH